jgi:hypothetical protein
MTYDATHRRLLSHYAECRRREAEAQFAARAAAAEPYAAAAGDAEASLREHWREQGWDLAELTRLLRQADYREGVLALYEGPSLLPGTEAYKRARSQQLGFASRLQEFWTASGHDFRELTGFLSQVDAEIFDMLPK